ncbi:hypothetical protein BGZ76_000811 [Entomortierella beljakovae]|nr:hypothetical protein BGZ76_000811 [Entomortierella beljakovae]
MAPVFQSTYHIPTPANPKVMIVGAGLGGLTLAILLERAGIDYDVYERAKSLRPLGSVVGLQPNILPLMEQLGLLDDLRNIWMEGNRHVVYKETEDGEGLDVISSNDFGDIESLCGYPSAAMPRPELQALLLAQIPAHKVHFSKRVLSITQDDEFGVMIRTSDGMKHEGDILVGCDGAYSSVRQSLYAQLNKDGKLSSSDAEDMKVRHMSILGITDPMDPNIVPLSEDGLCRTDAVLGNNKPYSWRYFEAQGNRFGWRLDIQLQSSTFENSDAFRNTDWGSESSSSIEDDWRAFKVPLGINGTYLTIGDLIESTPKDNVTKVMLEEKLYTTWYSRRTVLLGDACHKMLPNAGRGAVNAMLDAVVLANELYEIGSNADRKNIKVAFGAYYSDRYTRAKADFQSSQKMAKVFAGQTWSDVLMRKVILNFMPTALRQAIYTKTIAYRPQANFLPKIAYRGSGKVELQKESKRYQQEQAALT